jgi:hypothetical protein
MALVVRWPLEPLSRLPVAPLAPVCGPAEARGPRRARQIDSAVLEEVANFLSAVGLCARSFEQTKQCFAFCACGQWTQIKCQSCNNEDIPSKLKGSSP